MNDSAIVFSIFLIFVGGAIVATLALFTRQSLLVAYMALGALIGPYGFKLITDAEEIQHIGDIGIIFLLFLLGLHLHPQNLWHMLRKVTWIALISSFMFAVLGFFIGKLFGFDTLPSVVIGIAMMFSSTIIGLKLLPTTILHHQHTGELMISILLMQDLIAIIALLVLQGLGQNGAGWGEISIIAIGFPGLIALAFLVERFVLIKLLARFDQVQEYIFLLAIAWCLSLAEIARVIGLSNEIGAFIAGVAIAASPIALHIAESLKPLRDFFLVMFFFAIGASFNVQYLMVIWLPVLVLALLILVLKPLVFYYLLHRAKESKHVALEVGVRLGQVSEFSLLVAYVGASSKLIDPLAANLIQAATILTFVVSSYVVLLRYPTPLGLTERMRRD